MKSVSQGRCLLLAAWRRVPTYVRLALHLGYAAGVAVSIGAGYWLISAPGRRVMGEPWLDWALLVVLPSVCVAAVVTLLLSGYFRRKLDRMP